MKHLRFILFIPILICYTAHAGAKREIYLEWLTHDASSDVAVGIFAPCNDREMAQRHAFCWVWAECSRQDRAVGDYRVVPVWFMDAKVRNFKAKDADRIGNTVALILQPQE